MAVRRRVVAYGRVQGVFFRDSCQRVAASTGVSGSVRNRNDGAVEAVFEGDPDAVERMVAWMRQGPGRADVERVEVTDEDPQGESGFRVS
ncbi:MAG: acylphosphatase [Acidimicrobiia bacterium]|nr:acylphosphatase [Acidimicrobiia bacterium]